MARLHRREPSHRCCDREQLLITSPPDDAEGPIEHDDQALHTGRISRCSITAARRASLLAVLLAGHTLYPHRSHILPCHPHRHAAFLAGHASPFADRDVFAVDFQTSRSSLTGHSFFRLCRRQPPRRLQPAFADEMSYDDEEVKSKMIEKCNPTTSSMSSMRFAPQRSFL